MHSSIWTNKPQGRRAQEQEVRPGPAARVLRGAVGQDQVPRRQLRQERPLGSAGVDGRQDGVTSDQLCDQIPDLWPVTRILILKENIDLENCIEFSNTRKIGKNVTESKLNLNTIFKNNFCFRISLQLSVTRYHISDQLPH